MSDPSERPAAGRSHAYRRGAGSLLALGLTALLLGACSEGTGAGVAVVTPTPWVVPTPDFGYGGDGGAMNRTSKPMATPMSTPVPTPRPTATPTKAPALELPIAQLSAACNHAKGIAAAGKYAGHTHPLVDLYNNNGWSVSGYASGGKWLLTPLTAPIQLIACEGAEKTVRQGSCGTWKRSDGVMGEVVRYRYAVNVQILFARTGKTLSSKTLYGSSVACDSSWWTDDINPPWRIYGGHVDTNAVSNYEAAASKS